MPSTSLAFDQQQPRASTWPASRESPIERKYDAHSFESLSDETKAIDLRPFRDPKNSDRA